MVDGDPIERGPEIAFGVRHQLTCHGAEAFQFSRVLRGNDDAEMVTVVSAALRERLFVCDIGAGIEHAGISTIVRNAIPLQVDDVPSECTGAQAPGGMTYNVGLRKHPTRAGRTRQ
jgi:hypothetical protein